MPFSYCFTIASCWSTFWQQNLIILIPILYLHKHISSQIIKVNKYQLSDACCTADFPYTAWYYNMKQL